MSIRTDRLVLRPLELSDAPRIALLAGDFEVASMTGTIPHPYSEQMAGEWIGSALEGEEGTVFVIERDGALIGCVGYREDEKGAPSSAIGSASLIGDKATRPRPPRRW